MYLHAFLVTEFTLRTFHAQGKNLVVHCMGGWVLPRDTLDTAEGGRGNLLHLPEIESAVCAVFSKFSFSFKQN